MPYNSSHRRKGVFPYPIEKATLENGLRIFLIPTPADGLVAYWSIVRTGSGAEADPGLSGFAHLFEHMMFRGEQGQPEGDGGAASRAPIVDRSGYTSADFTAYYSNAAREDLPRVIPNEAFRFKHLRYGEDVFRTEAGAVLGEYLKEQSSPWNVLTESLLDTAFEKHPYGHTALGLKGDILNMPEQYAYSKQFYRRFYRPENIILLVIGDFDSAQTLALIEENYSDFQRGYIPPEVPQEPEQLQQRRARSGVSRR